MPGPTVTGRLEVEFVPGSGTWVDLSAQGRVSEVSIKHPPVRIGDETSPTTLQATIRNFPDPVTGMCPLTPGSPAGAYFPNVDRDRKVRFTAVVNGVTTYVRFLGWSDTWSPEAIDGDPNSSTVTLTASCVLSRYARRRVMSHFGERAIAIDARGLYYPFDESSDASTVRVVSGTPTGAYSGEMVQPNSLYPGGATFTTPDGGHLTDGQIDFTRGDDNSPAPIVLIKMRDPSLGYPTFFNGWYKLGADPKGSAGDDMIVAYNNSGDMLWTWSVRVASTLVTWAMTDNTGASMSFLATNAPRDETWHYWGIYLVNSTTTNIFTRTKGETGQQSAGSFVWSYDPRPVAWITVGGRMPPFRRSKQTNTFLGSISSLFIDYSTSWSMATEGNPGVVTTAGGFRGQLASYTTQIDALVGGAVSTLTGLEITPAMITTESTTLLERWNELSKSAGSLLFTRPDGRRHYSAAIDVHPLAVSLTLDANADLHMPAGGWAQSLDERPTRVQVESPEGTAIVVDTVTEASTGLQLEGPTLSTMTTLDGAKNAGWLLMASRGARLTVGMDATVTSTDQTVSLMGLLPGNRIRISNLPTQYVGVSYLDWYVAGWDETYTGRYQQAAFAFDLDPADDPPEARFDDAEYGRFAMDATGTTVTGGTCVGTTGTGTVVMTTGSPLATTVGNFPMDLNWNGERITISGVGGGTSPQTATVTGRGVAPTVARVHSAGEVVQIYHPATFSY